MIPVPTESNEEDDSPVPPDWQMPKIFRANNDK